MLRMFIRDLINNRNVQSYFKKRTFFTNPLLRYNVLAKEDFAMKEQKRFLELLELSGGCLSSA